MRKKIWMISVIAVIGFTGCSKAEIERNPVAIADAASLEDNIGTEVSKDGLADEEITKAPEAIETDKEAKAETKEEEAGNSGTAEKPIPVTIEIEGMKETVYGLWHAGDGYKIMYDVDRFEYSKKDGSDTFVAENPDPAIYPYVYLSINRLENKSTSDYVKELSDTLSKSGLKSETTTDASIGKYKGTIITARAGSEWNSIIRNYYIIENGTAVYILEAQYFLDAAEGYGARIHAMLNTFEMK
ncbi:MAG TPA: hypothetical protein GXX75_22045 [Clostridiales bacterium]|nr:hypothetical protein [Clostridiales bacterium]